MHMMTVVDKMGNAVHPIVPADVHDGICSTPTGKYSTPRFLFNMMSVVHLVENTVHQCASKCTCPSGVIK